MNDDRALSLYLDGRLPAEGSSVLERRLAGEPALSERLSRLRRLQALSAGLPETPGGFTPEEVRIRAGSRVRRPRAAAWAAAAVLLLALSHGGAYLLGTRRAPESPLEETERLLEQAAELDAAAPHDRLSARLVGLREDMDALPGRLAAVEGSRWERRRARELAGALAQLEIAFDQVRDSGFLGLIVKEIAVDSLEGAPEMRFVPASARSYGRVTPIESGRFRVFFMDQSGFVADEGTLEELQRRHAELQLVEEEK